MSKNFLQYKSDRLITSLDATTHRANLIAQSLRCLHSKRCFLANFLIALPLLLLPFFFLLTCR
jgi:hypothetical protein